jgi:hypothetical protein
MKISLYYLLSVSLLYSYNQLSAMEGAKPALPLTNDGISHFNRMAKIQALARSLEVSLNADAQYYELIIHKYKSTDTQPIKEFAAKTDLTKPTRHALKAIMKLTAARDVDTAVLENVISAIPPFPIKYVADTIENLPGTAKSKKLETRGYSVKDDTRNYQIAMLRALHGLKEPFYPIISGTME